MVLKSLGRVRFITATEWWASLFTVDGLEFRLMQTLSSQRIGRLPSNDWSDIGRRFVPDEQVHCLLFTVYSLEASHLRIRVGR